MAEQYWVGDFFVDATRNQITQKSQSQSIPPKALAVLTCLAKNANKVVTHDEILSQVWPDTIVTPNTLQRSIAQLRKVLNESNSTGENSRSYIKTHAKQGYSLEVEVKWQSAVSDTPDDAIVTTDKPTIEKTLKSPLTLVAIVLALITCTFIGLYISMSTSDLKLNIAEFNSLTATDHKEYSPIYTPDGQYVVFQRYSDKVCRNNNIWAKNTKTQEEFQLTKNMGAYGSHSFSIDGQKLVFIESNNCDKPINQKLCYQLMSMDFQKALKQPQSPTVLVECKSTKIARPKWLNNNNIALIHTFADRRQLISYSIIENKSTVFYELEEGDIVHFDYSAKDELIAIIRVHSDEQLYLDMVRFDGEVLSSHEIVLPDEIFGNRFIYPNFTPYASKLIFSTGRRLFTLSYQGEVSNISLPLNEAISSPIFHPSGKRMLVIKGHYDSDIALMSLTSMMSDDSYSILMRSTKGEDNAQFQPQGELIAFTSAKSGKSQLWITDGKSTQQLSDFPIDSFLYGLDWAVDGQSILVNVNKRLTRIFLEPRTVAVPFAHPVEQLFQWSSENNIALLMARIKGVLKFIELDINNGRYKIINDKQVKWALKSDDDRLIYIDAMEQFWLSGPVEDQLIEPLTGQGSDKGLLIKDNVIYGVNDNLQLWSYGLNDGQFNIVGNVPEKIDYITDINHTGVLLTLRIAAKKEVAEIVLVD